MTESQRFKNEDESRAWHQILVLYAGQGNDIVSSIESADRFIGAIRERQPERPRVFSLIVVGTGNVPTNNQVPFIKELRNIGTFSLREAKDVLDGNVSRVVFSGTYEDAKDIERRLVSFGAACEIKQG